MVAGSPTLASHALLTASSASLRLAAANTTTLSSACAAGAAAISAAKPPIAIALNPKPLRVSMELSLGLKFDRHQPADRYIRLNITTKAYSCEHDNGRLFV